MRRSLILLATIALLLLGLTACGGDDKDTAEDSGSVTVTGEPGQEPTVELEGDYHRNGLETSVVSEGEGEPLARGDLPFLRMYLVNGFDGEVGFSSWRNGNQEFFPLDGSLPGLTDALVGKKVGARVLIEGNGRTVFGQYGQPALFVAPDDPIALVVDVVSEVRGPIPFDPASAPAGEPKITVTDGIPTALDFSEAPEQMPTEARVVTLVKGDGPALTEDSVMVMRYLGQVWGAEEPFDDNFGRPLTADDVQPLTTYVPGFLANLPGVTVGSRVLLVLPPAQGYGEKGNPDAGIKGTDTIVFVVDVVGAYEPTEPVVDPAAEPSEEPSPAATPSQ